MDPLTLVVLSLAFALYATAGFGGGRTCMAPLSTTSFPRTTVPVVSLMSPVRSMLESAPTHQVAAPAAMRSRWIAFTNPSPS